MVSQSSASCPRNRRAGVEAVTLTGEDTFIQEILSGLLMHSIQPHPRAQSGCAGAVESRDTGVLKRRGWFARIGVV